MHIQADSLEEAQKIAKAYVQDMTLAENNDYPEICTDQMEVANYTVLDCDNDNIRRCDHCGKPMSKGYYLGGEYACSDECCLALYDGDKAQMEEDLSHAEEDDAECYYTEWESIYFD